MALGQQNVLFLELSADGAGDEAVVLVDIATEPALSDAPMTVTLMGDEEVTLTIALPDGTMQGVVTASATDCTGNFIEEEAYMMLSNDIDSAGVFILEAEIELPYCEGDDDDDDEDDDEGFDEFEDLDLDELTAYLDSLCSDAMGNEAWMYCGLLESLNACLDGDEDACDEIEEWLELVDGPWNDDEEDDDEEDEDDEEDNENEEGDDSHNYDDDYYDD